MGLRGFKSLFGKGKHDAISDRVEGNRLPGNCVVPTCVFPRQAYRHYEAATLFLKTRPPVSSSLLTLLECDRICSLFFAPSGDVGL
jgi:hypothetical protein